jgi:hypothetical protein
MGMKLASCVTALPLGDVVRRGAGELAFGLASPDRTIKPIGTPDVERRWLMMPEIPRRCDARWRSREWQALLARVVGRCFFGVGQ